MVLSGLKSGQMERLLSNLKRDKAALLSGIIIVIIIIISVFAPVIAPYNPNEQNLEELRLPPGENHLFGTDEFGRDLLSRVMFGASVSLLLGLVSIIWGLLIGIPLGLLGGYYGGIVDSFIARAIDILLAFPTFLTAILIIAVFGPGFVNVTIAIGITRIPSIARIVRGSVLSIKEKEFVMAARALGATNKRIITRHIFPNSIAPIIVLVALQTATAIILGASLSFIGLGVQPPTPEWGLMISSGRSYIIDAPHLVLVPGLALMITVFSINVFADSLRDAFER